MTRKGEDRRDPLADLQAALVEMNLTTLARRLSELLAQAEGETLSFSAFLARALDVERQSRRERRVQRSRRANSSGWCARAISSARRCW